MNKKAINLCHFFLVSTLFTAINALSPLTSLRDLDSVIANNNGPVVLKFYIQGCRPCQQIAPLMEQIAECFANKATFLEVNARTSSDIAQKYGIRAVPTVIILRGGEIHSRLSSATIASHIERILLAITTPS